LLAGLPGGRNPSSELAASGNSLTGYAQAVFKGWKKDLRKGKLSFDPPKT
jgi:hypothetical protein